MARRLPGWLRCTSSYTQKSNWADNHRRSLCPPGLKVASRPSVASFFCERGLIRVLVPRHRGCSFCGWGGRLLRLPPSGLPPIPLAAVASPLAPCPVGFSPLPLGPLLLPRLPSLRLFLLSTPGLEGLQSFVPAKLQTLHLLSLPIWPFNRLPQTRRHGGRRLARKTWGPSLAANKSCMRNKMSMMRLNAIVDPKSHDGSKHAKKILQYKL